MYKKAPAVSAVGFRVFSTESNKEQQIANLLLFMFFVIVKGKTGGSRPAIRLTFFNAKKVSKKAGS